MGHEVLKGAPSHKPPDVQGLAAALEIEKVKKGARARCSERRECLSALD